MRGPGWDVSGKSFFFGFTYRASDYLQSSAVIAGALVLLISCSVLFFVLLKLAFLHIWSPALAVLWLLASLGHWDILKGMAGRAFQIIFTAALTWVFPFLSSRAAGGHHNSSTSHDSRSVDIKTRAILISGWLKNAAITNWWPKHTFTSLHTVLTCYITAK